MKLLDIDGEYVPPSENKTRRRYTQVDSCYSALPSSTHPLSL